MSIFHSPELLRKYESRKLLAGIKTSMEPADPQERAVQSAMRRRQQWKTAVEETLDGIYIRLEPREVE